jgi:hypothetical protein
MALMRTVSKATEVSAVAALDPFDPDFHLVNGQFVAARR